MDYSTGAQAQLEQFRHILSQVPEDILKRVPDWKQKYPNLFTVGIRGRWYVYRPATLAESQVFTSLAKIGLYDQPVPIPLLTQGIAPKIAEIAYRCVPPKSYDLAREAMISTLLLYPEVLDLDTLLQGDVTALARSMWECTGFDNEDIFSMSIQMARDRFTTRPDDFVTAFVCRALNMTPDQVVQLDLQTLARHIAMAEFVSGSELPLNFNNTVGMDTSEQQALSLAAAQSGNIRQSEHHPPAQGPMTRAPVVQPNMDNAPQGIINVDEENKMLKDFMSAKR